MNTAANYPAGPVEALEVYRSAMQADLLGWQAKLDELTAATDEALKAIEGLVKLLQQHETAIDKL